MEMRWERDDAGSAGTRCQTAGMCTGTGRPKSLRKAESEVPFSWKVPAPALGTMCRTLVEVTVQTRLGPEEGGCSHTRPWAAAVLSLLQNPKH